MKQIYQTLLLLLVSTGSVFCQDYSNVNYAGDGQGYHNLDIYLPSTAQDKYPVVIYIYGSAWYSNSGKGADMTTVGKALLDAGFAVVTPNHRSSSDAQYPAQIHDIKAVIRFVRGSSAQYKFDTSFIATAGSSSGGHLATLAGSTNGVGDYTIGNATINLEGNLGSFTNFSSEVDAVVDFFGPIDFHKMESNCTTYKSGNSPEAAMIGGEVGQNMDKAALLSPINYVESTDPPILIFHGQQDNVVPYCQSQLLYDKYQNAGVESEVVFVPSGQHGPGVNDNQQNLNKMVEFLLDKIDPVPPAEREPFNGVSHMIPGRIEAEEYDKGGEGLGFHETNSDGNQGGAPFRNDQVDIEETGDSDGDYNIAYIQNGEWLSYSVNVSATGNYNLTLRVATEQDNKSMHVELDGNDVTGTIEIPTSGGWQTYQNITVKNVMLTEGEHILRFVFESDYFNFNYFTFTSVVTSFTSLSEASAQVNVVMGDIIVSSNSKTKYQICTSSGLVVETGNCNGTCTIGEQLASGMYLVTLSNNDITSTQKVIK